jgi:hypothetical protein
MLRFCGGPSGESFVVNVLGAAAAFAAVVVDRHEVVVNVEAMMRDTATVLGRAVAWANMAAEPRPRKCDATLHIVCQIDRSVHAVAK